MANIKKKTYDDTFLFTLPGEKMKHHNHITDYIIRSERIENKRNDNFRGVIEDIRRYQKSAVIYHILMRDDVVLCTNEVEMPPAFKVFIAKDPKANGTKKVFIDVTGIIEFKNGAYICKNVQRFITYLFEAITWLLYEYEPEALLNNSNITLAATDCFVKLFDYILGYFRFYGFSDNRTKINYLSALYFMITILGKDDDQYTHQVAAKLTGLDQSLTKSFSLYYDQADLANIDSFINLLAETFKLKGLTTEVFISRWMQNCGNGTQFAPELFTAFSNMMIAAYCGAYIVNQKSIDKLCSASMVKLCDNILRLGSSQLDRGKLFENFMNPEEIPEPVDEHVRELQEAISITNIPRDNMIITQEDCSTVDAAKKKIKAIKNLYHDTGKDPVRFSAKASESVRMALRCMTSSHIIYEDGTLTAILNESAKYLSTTALKSIYDGIQDTYRYKLDEMREYRTSDEERAKIASINTKELMECLNIVSRNLK